MEHSYERAWILGDVHWGVYSAKFKSWMNMMEDFFDNEFIPFLERNHRPGDVLIQLGDWFDNQSSINIKVGRAAADRMSRIAKIMPVHMIVGNHDIWGKGSVKEDNSLFMYSFMPNVFVHDAPHRIGVAGKTALLVPWYHSKVDEEQVITGNQSECDILFCHSDLVGSKTTMRADIDARKQQIMSIMSTGHDAMELSTFSSYERVYSGHIHIRHTQGNFNFVGTPYELTTNDMDNAKGWHLLDREGTHFFENTTSPRFIKVIVESTEDIDKVDKDVVTKNHCTIVVNNDLLADLSTRRAVNRLLTMPWKDRVFKRDEEAVERAARQTAARQTGPVVLDRANTRRMALESIDAMSLPDGVKEDMRVDLDRAFSMLDLPS